MNHFLLEKEVTLQRPKKETPVAASSEVVVEEVKTISQSDKPEAANTES